MNTSIGTTRVDEAMSTVVFTVGPKDKITAVAMSRAAVAPNPVYRSRSAIPTPPPPRVVPVKRA